MPHQLYRYRFDSEIEIDDVDSTLLLSILATENLHGESQVRLDASHYLDLDTRVCVIDATTAVGRDINRLFTGFLCREYGEDKFQVERVEHADAFVQTANH